MKLIFPFKRGDGSTAREQEDEGRHLVTSLVEFGLLIQVLT